MSRLHESGFWQKRVPEFPFNPNNPLHDFTFSEDHFGKTKKVINRLFQSSWFRLWQYIVALYLEQPRHRMYCVICVNVIETWCVDGCGLLACILWDILPTALYIEPWVKVNHWGLCISLQWGKLFSSAHTEKLCTRCHDANVREYLIVLLLYLPLSANWWV